MNKIELRKHHARVKKYQEERERYKIWFKQDAQRLSRKYKSATHYMLAALIPYSEANLKLTFSPSQYFSDLSKIDYINQKNSYTANSLRNAYYRAVKKGLVTIEEGLPKLTTKGQRKLNFYQPKILKGDARLLVVFDIPEDERRKRDKLRTILKEFRFRQVQRSVWECRYDCRKYIEMALEEDGIQDYVILYEAGKII